MKKWASRLLGHKFTILTDHKNILQLNKAEAPKIVRWRLQMQQFNYTVLHVPGESQRHAIVDCLSRLHGPLPATPANVSLVKTRSRAEAVEEKQLNKLFDKGNYDERLADKLLILYLARCKHKHALAFMQYRKTLPNAKLTDIQEIFNERKELLRRLADKK